MKRLVLVGGGHSHLEVLRRLANSPAHGLDVLLASPDRHAIYSGMMPGVVAGDYVLEDCRIDLEALARSAGARMVQAPACGMDAARVHLANGESHAFDVASLDVGSGPPSSGLPGLAQHAIAVRPAEAFLDRLHGLLASRREALSRGIAIVGAGAGGVELALTIACRLEEMAPGAGVRLITEGGEILAGMDACTRGTAESALRARGVQLHLGAGVTAVHARGLCLADGREIDADAVIWAGGAAAQPWLGGTPLAKDGRGFVSINDCLQSVSHPSIFAAGDCATNMAAPMPKSGVTAVRQGPVLAENLLRACRGEAPVAFRASPAALVILNCGGGQAVASWRGHSFRGRWVWRWKHWLDTRFVRRYTLSRR